MIEDVLEQLAEDYYSSRPGFFTKHNVKFRPSATDSTYDARLDSVHSDIDVIAVRTGTPKIVYAVSCKSWQSGFSITAFMKGIEEAICRQPTKTKGKRDTWCNFRELCIKKWTVAFAEVLRKEISVPQDEEIKIDYSIVCTRITPGSLKHRRRFEMSDIIKRHFHETGNAELQLRVLTVTQLVRDLIQNIKNKTTTSVEMTELSRTIQILLASGCDIRIPNEEEEHSETL